MAITQALIDKTETNLNRWDDIVNEDENGTTTLDNALIVKSLAGYLAEFKSYNILGAWQTGYSYSIKDVAKKSGNHYICLDPHTSGTFSTDLSSGKWGLFQVDFSNLTATGTFTGTFTGDLTGDVTGSVLQASQTNITTLGILTSLSVLGDATFDTSLFFIDSTNGRVGLGTTSPTGTNTALYDDATFHIHQPNTGSRGSQIHLTNASTGVLAGDGCHISSYSNEMYIVNQENGPIKLYTNSTERMQITSAGALFLNTNSDPGGISTGYGFNISASSQLANAASNKTVAYFNRTDSSSSGGTLLSFRLNGTQEGSISITSTATSYNTTSDYRLKENVTPIIDGIARLMEMKPSRFNFIKNKNQIVDGFLAHEVQKIIPEAITGEKDEVSEDGFPKYQSIDQSKIVPLLVASVQDLKKELDALKK